MLEVCIDSLESAINAIHGGADELEVCSTLTEGGLTPSPGLVKQIMEMVNNIAAGKPIRESCHDCGCDKLTKRPKVNVMIRCRTGSDFHYSLEEMDTMLSDVEVFKAFGVDRFVFGALTETRDIDVINCKRFIRHADATPVTFHRAFDVCNNPLSAINTIAGLGFNRVLTSGQKASANDLEAIQLIKALVGTAGDKIEIMPGAGINLDNVKTFIDIGCKIVHSSCKKIKYLPQVKSGLSMGTSDSEHVLLTNETIVEKMKETIT
ncbi:PF03932 family protein CutC [Helicoverpa zea]|uniref:PF03932 family protein CutC n=1 Tax=Helicoverpa zea TaxID=7113 RepID=UPI001F59D227|nr:PF03932 family protein CutC [Helicoverpa zea]